MVKRNIAHVTREEYEAVRDAAITGWRWTHGPVDDSVVSRFITILDTLYRTGCHASVLLAKKAGRGETRGTIRPEIQGGALVWRRAKTGRQMRAILPPQLAGPLQSYLDQPKLPYSTFLAQLHVLSEKARTRRLYPLMFRHNVAMRVFKAHGPGAAQAALGVSDRVLKDYMSMADEKAQRATYEAMEEQ